MGFSIKTIPTLFPIDTRAEAERRDLILRSIAFIKFFSWFYLILIAISLSVRPLTFPPTPPSWLNPGPPFLPFRIRYAGLLTRKLNFDQAGIAGMD